MIGLWIYIDFINKVGKPDRFLFSVLQTYEWKPSNAPPKISIGVSCVIFQGGSLLTTQKCDKVMEFYEISP